MRRLEFTLCFLLFAAIRLVAGEPDYKFSIEGQPFEPLVLSLNGDNKHPQPGDLINLNEMLLTLGEQRICAFETAPEGAGILLENEDGRTNWVAACVKWTYKDGNMVILNPLEKLSEQEIHGLWGLRLDYWDDAIAKKIKAIDPQRTCVTITGQTAQGETKTLPPLLDGLCYLNVEQNSSEGLRNFTALKDQNLLVFLHLTMGRPEFLWTKLKRR